jgi:glycogen debranching enzyme
MIKNRLLCIPVLCALIPGILNCYGQANKGHTMQTHTIVLSKKDRPATDTVISIAFIARNADPATDPELKAAYEFLSKLRSCRSSVVTFDEIRKHPGILKNYKIAWYHRPDTTAFSGIESDKKIIKAYKDYVKDGGNLLLTLDAFRYPFVMGLETVPPGVHHKACIDEGYGRKLGFHAFLDHPVFAGMNGGAYVNRPKSDMPVRVNGYFGDTIPKEGKVVAVDWDYIFLREDSKIVLEYSYGKGKILTAGAYVNFSVPNFNRAHLEMFIANSFRYLSGVKTGNACRYWDYSPSFVREGLPVLGFNELQAVVLQESRPWPEENDPLELSDRYSSGNFWDVAGERMLTMGNENGGIEEVWAHPFMAFRDYEAGIRFEYRDTIYWLNDERPQVETGPASFKRTYKFPRAYLTEIIANDPEEPTGVIHYEYHGVYAAEMCIRFKSNLRLMWPYSEKVTGGIYHQFNNALEAFMVADKYNDMALILGADRKPLQTLSGQYSIIEKQVKNEGWKGDPTENCQVAALLTYRLQMTDRMDVVYSATGEGLQKTLEYYRKALSDPYQVLTNEKKHVDKLFANSLLITTPDPDFNQGYRWALAATDRFFVNTPGMGKSLVAGYATTRKGWDGAQKVSGRPGYGWYFGRDGEWSGFALIDYGDFSKVRSELEFYMKYQDLSGKILHEASTSGVVHYDASDATPLFIVLAGKYFRHSGDTAFLRKSWPSVKEAINFCFSTDTDGDHLIENTNVGHGWVEGGELYGSHATLYMAGSWAQALEESANMAHFMKDYEEDSYRSEAQTVREIINSDFWDSDGRFFSYGKNKNGKFRHEPTVLPAVPLYFRLGDPEKAAPVLDQYASNAFTTNWGVRILRDDSPYFNPNGYHYGSVWPLFTGWTALAEFSYRNYIQGFSHIMNNLNVYKYWGKGFVEEVLNGSEYRPSGVCPHQCWSETMVLQPAIEGLLGLDVRLQEKKILLAPHLPADWDSLEVANIRAGENAIGFRMDRTTEKYTYIFTPGAGTEINMEFTPSFPAGTIFKKVLVDKKEIPVSVFSFPQNLSLLTTLKITGKTVVEVYYDKGIAVLPVVQDPKPGYPAEGLRIISTSFKGNRYRIDLEDKPKSEETILVYINGQEIAGIQNGRLQGIAGKIAKITIDFGPGEEKYLTKTVVIDLK